MLKPRFKEDNKTLFEDSDEYFDMKKQKKWNKWDQTLNEIKVFSEDDLAGWVIGDNFIAQTLPEKGQISSKIQEEVKQDQEESKTVTEASISQEAVQLKKI